jgi:hypothetical protein
MPEVDKIDFNGESVPEASGQAETTEESSTVEEPETAAEPETENVQSEEVVKKEEESVEELKARLAKVEEEKENYKQMGLKYKNLTLEKSEKEESTEGDDTEEEEYPDWDENSKKFQKQTLAQAEKLAEAKAQQAIHKANEKTAIGEFVKNHPEAAEKWNEVVSNYVPKAGKDSVQDILKDLDRAYVLTRYEKGELSNLENEAFKKGESKGKAESKLAELNSVSKTTAKTVKGEGGLSAGALKLAEKMRVSPDKLALEDDSLTAEIKF